MKTYVAGDPVELRSIDGRTLRVEFGPYSFSVDEAREAAKSLLDAAAYANVLPDIHERHVNLKASCALCVREAGDQPDRLEFDPEED